MSEQGDKVICKACGKEFQTERQLHAHIKVHNLRVVEYYQKFYPRHDLYDGKIIKYKTIGERTGSNDGTIISLIAALVNKSTNLP